MARPKKEPHEKRDEVIRARVTAAEKAYVAQQARAANLDPAEYIRRRALGFVVTPSNSAADAALISELNRIGVNVNQLARAVNSGRVFKGDWQAIRDELRRLLAEVALRYGSQDSRQGHQFQGRGSLRPT